MSAPAPLRITLVGYGRMGRLVDALAESYGCEIVARLDEANNANGSGIAAGTWVDADVAVDFSTAEAFAQNLPRLAARGVHVVAGTTGWQAQADTLRRAAAGIGVVAAPNFSVGALVFQATVARAAALFAGRADVGAWIHEAHHAAKRDAPSGTALALQRAMLAEGYARGIDMASSRAGSIPGTHTVGFDGPADTVTLTHTVRDRSVFAHGALMAVRWIHGRRGWFDMYDVLGLRPAPSLPAQLETRRFP